MEYQPIGKVATPNVLAEIRIQLVNQDGSVGVNVSTSADPISSLGLLEMAKDALKQQNNQPKSPLVIARGNVPS